MVSRPRGGSKQSCLDGFGRDLVGANMFAVSLIYWRARATSLLLLPLISCAGNLAIADGLVVSTPYVAERSSPVSDERFSVHGQATGIWQGYGRIRSPYEGENSLPGGGQGRETISVTPAIGIQTWQGGAIYLNPELFQGFGLAQTHGLGGFSNGEAQKGGSLYPKGYVARVYLQQTFGLGGSTEKVESDFNQLGGTRDVSRVTVTSGKFAVNDIFDRNSVSQDGRNGFMNYALWAGGAFDYSADQKGYGAGSVIDLNQKDWAVRVGRFLIPIKSNAQTLSWISVAKARRSARSRCA